MLVELPRLRRCPSVLLNLQVFHLVLLGGRLLSAQVNRLVSNSRLDGITNRFATRFGITMRKFLLNWASKMGSSSIESVADGGQRIDITAESQHDCGKCKDRVVRTILLISSYIVMGNLLKTSDADDEDAKVAHLRTWIMRQAGPPNFCLSVSKAYTVT
ncbi:hypothetical protein BDB00DRAFT_867240 [Zychaea mexicana]|uniref:uncharacterized protein n=1 Tax=Zychaea mexicana TaxID=64656 RepID=UPI0022FE1F1D|nr:uncharacterized protein BDB00DRAFT_867240 [Zychaea mexicana]KAI9498609.1 hypothetical protein BDB00DRAFT_867240 [Zychaea mexicana]